MSEKIEQVARAIWETRRRIALDANGIELEAWGDGTYPRANHIFEEARSAVEAMREPTEEMWAACDRAKADFETGIAWPVMIDAALALPQAAPETTSCRFPDCDCADDKRCHVAISLSRPQSCECGMTDSGRCPVCLTIPSEERS